MLRCEENMTGNWNEKCFSDNYTDLSQITGSFT